MTDKIQIGDKVTSHLSLWKGDIGTVSGIVDNIIHVVFPENDKHYGYQQTFNNANQLIKI